MVLEIYEMISLSPIGGMLGESPILVAARDNPCNGFHYVDDQRAANELQAGRRLQLRPMARATL